MFDLASTQRKEVIRCLMVQQRGRSKSFARWCFSLTCNGWNLRPLTMSKGIAALPAIPFYCAARPPTPAHFAH